MAAKRKREDAAATGDPPPSSSAIDAAAAAATDDESKSDGTASSPLSLPLLAFHQYEGDCMFMLSISDQILHKNLDHYGLLRQRGNLFWSTPQGWMLIMKFPLPQVQGEGPDTTPTAVYLWNPRTGDKLPLPNIQEYHDTLLVGTRCRLTHKDPAHPGCVIVLLLGMSGTLHESTMWYCHIAGGGGWRRCSYHTNDGLPLPLPISIPIFQVAACQGKLYFLTLARETTIGAIDFSSSTAKVDGPLPVFQYFDVPRIEFHNGCSASKWLVESNDRLFLVCRFFFVGDSGGYNLGTIGVYEMDFSARVWRRVHDIGDAVIFLNHQYTAASCAATPLGLKPNQVYFSNYDCSHDGAYLCVFDLGLDIMENITWIPLQNSRGYFGPFWIVPPAN